MTPTSNLKAKTIGTLKMQRASAMHELQRSRSSEQNRLMCRHMVESIDAELARRAKVTP